MKIDLEPLLTRQREIYDQAPGRDRFRHYLDVMVAGTGDIALPLALMNPMGKPHVAAMLDALIDLRAEEIAAEALIEARRRLSGVAADAALRFGLVVVDDARGGWTNRYTTEMAHRFGRSGELNRGWVVGLLWTSESVAAGAVRTEVLTAVYRALHRCAHGNPGELAGMLFQEGRAAAFASNAGSAPDPELAVPRAILKEHLDSTEFPVQFACLYGDEIAETLGYRTLGLSPYAGYRVATEDARLAPAAPEAALRSRAG